jgi:hypothetical protein
LGRARRLALILSLACAMLATLALPASAPAARGLVTGFQADQYVSSDPAERALWLDRTEAAGAGIVRLPAVWSTVAPGAQKPADPTNPGSTSYDFPYLDGAVRDLAKRGIKVILNVGPGIPTWAEAPGRPDSFPAGRWKPQNPQDVADFIQAVAARYSGKFDPDGSGPAGPLPAADAIEVWNEPNGEPWISRQYNGTPDFYRQMLNLSYRAIKAVNPQMLVVVGGTSPYGDPPNGPYPSTGGRVYPVTFWEQVLCVRPVKAKKKKKKKGASKVKYVRTPGCNERTLFDVFAHHPIDNTGGGPLQSGPTKFDASTPDLGRVVAILRGAERAGTTLPGKHPVWVTEYWWDSNPPNPSGASLAVQARWVEQSLFLFWKAGANTAINFNIRDSDFRPTVRAGYQAGLFFDNGRPKPALTAFHFPFVTERINRAALLAWGKSPEAGKLIIQRQQKARWVPVKKLRVGKGAVFTTKLKLSGKQRLRAVVGSERSLVWKQAANGTRSRGGGGLPSAGTILLMLVGAALLALIAAAVFRRRHVVRRTREARRQRRARTPRSGLPPGETAIAWGATDGGRITGHPPRRRGR